MCVATIGMCVAMIYRLSRSILHKQPNEMMLKNPRLIVNRINRAINAINLQP